MLETTSGYRLVAKDIASALSRTASDRQVARDVAYWKANIGKVKTIDDFVGDTRLFNFAMEAFGLKDFAYAKGFMKKLLQGGVEDASSMANRLSDPRYKTFAKAFDFSRYGAFATGMSEAQTATDRFVRQKLEASSGEGVRLALYFQRNAPNISDAMGLLADAALAKVVRTALQLSDSTALAPVEQQAAQIAARIDVADFKTPAKLDAFLRRFTTFHDLSQTDSSALLPMTNGGAGIGVDTLMSLARLRRGA